jgi:hypothetical protein
MTRVAVDAIIDLLRQHPDGLDAFAVCAHFGAKKTSLGSRLSRLAAYGVIRVAIESRCVLPSGKTTGAQTRRYFAPQLAAHTP